MRSNIPLEPRWETTYSDPLDIRHARETWAEIIQSMAKEGTLRVVNGHAIMRLCNFRVIFEQMRNAVVEEGVLLPTRPEAKQTVQYNPHWIVMRQSDESICRIEAALGIDPVRRTKAIKSEATSEEPEQAKPYLEKVA